MDASSGPVSGRLAPAARAFGIVVALTASAGAHAQNAECDRLRAALAQPVRIDPSAAAEARKARAELDRAEAYAHSVGCDNQQFLFFGSPPPPQCNGLNARIAALKNRYGGYAARASGDSPQRQALRARYDELCGGRPRNIFESLFGSFSNQRDGDQGPVERIPENGAEGSDQGSGSHAHGGSEAVCVRTCDGGYFPLFFSARAAPEDQLQNLCQALCPNAEIKLFTRTPHSDISTALGADGTAYSDLPNALKFTKSFDASCTCKPPNQSWVEALAHAEQLLDQMGGARASDTTVTEQQSQAMAQPQPPKPDKDAKLKPSLSPTPAPAAGGRVIESAGPDGAPRQVRVIGPNF
ncbi:MAG TPA: DUF2865 domain-containing protein [Rhodoblastus sp.]|nr:DUF2865 domain-containing protein [Rhodoblastus sp.]